MYRRSAIVTIPTGNTAQEHSARLAEHVKDRDANPVQIQTPYGIWKSGKGGTGATESTTGEWAQPYTLKAKYTGR
jgi:hypothetical protein